MIKNSSNICSVWYYCIVCIVFISVFSVNDTLAQNHLTPGYSGSSGDYDLALKTVFKEAYSSDVKLRVQIKGDGIESMTGIRSDSTGFHIFHLRPTERIRYSMFTDRDCINIYGNELPEVEGRNCQKRDFSSEDSLQVNRFQISIDSSLAYLLTSLWEEMLIMSKYQPQKSIMIGGTTYYDYSAFLFGYGIIYAHKREPQEGTFTGDLAAISKLMISAATAERSVISDSLINQIEIRADKLMRKLLRYGDDTPSRSELNKTIKGCESEYREIVESAYCWQAYLASDEIPTLLIANKTNGSYLFEFVDITNPVEIRKIHVLPVQSIRSLFNRHDPKIQWEYYLMEPWDIIDLITNTMNGDFQVFGYNNFTLSNENIHYTKNSFIIHFDGVVPSRDMRVKLDIDGESGWFSVKDLFNSD